MLISIPLSPAQGLGQDTAGAPLRLLSEMKAEEERRREKREGERKEGTPVLEGPSKLCPEGKGAAEGSE